LFTISITHALVVDVVEVVDVAVSSLSPMFCIYQYSFFIFPLVRFYFN